MNPTDFRHTHTIAVDDAVRLLVRNAPRTRERRLMKRAVLVVTDGFPVGDTGGVKDGKLSELTQLMSVSML
jgi:hypothetical protein